MQQIEPSQNVSSRRRKKRSRSRSKTGDGGALFGKAIDGLLWCEPFWIALLSPLVLFSGMFLPEEYLPFVLLALFLFWPLRLLAGRKLLYASPHNGLVWILLLCLPIPFLISVNKALSWEAIGYLLLGLTAYAALTNWPLTRKRPELIAVAICAVGVALAIAGPRLIQRVPTKLFDSSELTIAVENARIESTEAINSNVLAGGLLLAMPFLFAFAVSPNSFARKDDDISGRGLGIVVSVVSALALLGVVAVIGLAQSRGAYIATAITLCLLVFLRWPRTWPIISLLLITGAGFLYWVDIDRLIGYSTYDNSVNSFSGRTQIWQRAWEMILDFPFTGTGIGTFGDVSLGLYPYAIYPDTSTGLRYNSIPHAHNLLLQIGVDLGLLGIIATVGIFISALILFSRAYLSSLRAKKFNLLFALSLGGIGAITAMWIHGIFDAVTWGTKLAFLPWLVIALAVLLQQSHLQPRRKRSRSTSEIAN